uniref:Protein kinase domain-containing protein n=1 Tax=Oncorhynchus kisutch TaxID=8019 RepID=A0A8C7FE50_ONCKI
EMDQLRNQTISNAERLIGLVERYNLFHVKTLCYNDVQSVLVWLGVKPEHFTFRQNEDTQEYPVMDGCSTMSYKTTTPRTAKVTIDKFGRTYKPLSPAANAHHWSIYANISGPRGSKCGFDIEDLVSRPDMVLGRGGFGVTVQVNDHLVAKTNLFPEMVDWSVPFIDNEFCRYAHIASQVEEVMIAVSIKHPNILCTFGGFWCDIAGYQLGCRAVVVMERALFSLQEFMWRIQNASVVPLVELDTLRGLEYMRSRTIQHRDSMHRNVFVCHQPDRNTIPFAFKISDFGTSCNFSTPDQPRGNRTNMAPEVLWCLNSAMGSDIFSWYCVMWELHSGSPLFQYKGSDDEYCKMTYAANLSDMVGVYRPEDNETLGILLCITLFPQERWSPSRLLNLDAPLDAQT